MEKYSVVCTEVPKVTCDTWPVVPRGNTSVCTCCLNSNNVSSFYRGPERPELSKGLASRDKAAQTKRLIRHICPSGHGIMGPFDFRRLFKLVVNSHWNLGYVTCGELKMHFTLGPYLT